MARHWFFGDRPPLTEDERRLILRVITVMSIPFALIVLVAAVAGFIWWQYQTDNRIEANKEAIQTAVRAAERAEGLAKDLERERVDRETAVRDALALLCRENEAQDAALILVLEGAIRERRQLPQNPARVEFIEVLRDAVKARAPVNTEQCRLP